MSSSKDRILDSAERVVLREGASHLTIDAVARDANLSKGGVLYNFPTKEHLIRAMIARLTEQFGVEMEHLAEADSCPSGRLTRAYISASFPAPTTLSACQDRLCAGLLAAVSNDPTLLEPLQETARNTQATLMMDGIDPVVATIIRLAVDGLWMSDLFGVNLLDQDMRTQVLERLRSLTKESHA